MLLDLEHVKYMHEEYERRVDALLLERAVLKARAERSSALAHLVGACLRAVTGLMTAVGRLGERALHQRWALSKTKEISIQQPTNSLSV